MKKLARFGYSSTAGMIPAADGGAWVKYDDAMRALADRQDALDAAVRRAEGLQTCVDTADRLRAFVARFPDDEEALLCARMYDETRRNTMGPDRG